MAGNEALTNQYSSLTASDWIGERAARLRAKIVDRSNDRVSSIGQPVAPEDEDLGCRDGVHVTRQGGRFCPECGSAIQAAVEETQRVDRGYQVTAAERSLHRKPTCRMGESVCR